MSRGLWVPGPAPPAPSSGVCERDRGEVEQSAGTPIEFQGDERMPQSLPLELRPLISEFYFLVKFRSTNGKV